jgi:tetratricopeptide (TPR) repeat protein
MSVASLRRLVGLVPLVFLVSACSGSPGGEAEGDGGSVDSGSPANLPEWLARVMEEDARGSAQAVSLLGEELRAMDPVDEAMAEAIAAADAALRADPGNVELLIEAGRVRRNAWQYRQEMAFYTRALELDPEDWRPWRFRGHRFLSVREFDAGIRDLERARELAPRDWDVAYHLGLAYFLAGRFGDAADEYLRCLALAEGGAAEVAGDLPGSRSCTANATDPESQVAMMEWSVRALLRAGREQEAERLFTSLPADLEVGTNVAYHHNLLLYRGEWTEEELLDIRPDGPYRLETVGFGIANRRLAEGDAAGAEALLRELAADPWWPGFGRIAAEVEVARLRR